MRVNWHQNKRYKFRCYTSNRKNKFLTSQFNLVYEMLLQEPPFSLLQTI